MAASAKQFQLLFQLKAALGPNFSQTFKTASNTMKTMQTSIKEANEKLKDISAYQKQQKAVENSRARVDEAQKAYNDLEKEIGDVNSATAEQKKQLNSAGVALKKAENAAAEEKEKLDQMSNSLKNAGINTENLGKDTDKLRKEYERLEKAQKKVNEIGAKQEANKEVISQTKGQLMGMAGTITAIGAAIYSGPVKKAAEFQEQMSTVQAISGATGNDLVRLSDKAKEMGAKTKYTATEAGQAMEYMAMAGWGTGDMLKGIGSVMNLASASGEDLATTSDIVTDALTAFGLSAKDANHFADVLAVTSTSTNTNVGKMGETFKYVAPVVGSLYDSAEDATKGMEDSAKAIGLIANSGIKASQAGTTFRSIITRLSTDAGASSKQLGALGILTKKLGVDFYDSTGKVRPLNDIITESRAAWKGLTKEEQQYYAKKIAGQNAISGWNALMNASAKDINKLETAFSDTTGAAEKMAAIKLDNLNGDITLMKSAWDALNVSLGEMLMPSLRNTVQWVTKVINAANNFTKKNPETVKTIAKLAAGLIGLKAGGLIAKLGFLEVKGGILSIQKAFTMIRGLGITKFLGSMGGGFGGILTKIFPLVGVITAVGGAIYYVSTHLEQVRGFIQKTFGNEGLAVFDKLWGIITQVGTAIKDAFFTSGNGMLDTLKSMLPAITNTLKSGLLQILPMLADMVTQILPLIGQLIAEILPVLGELVGAVTTVLATMISEILPVIIQLISEILPLVTQIVQSILPVFIELVNTIVPILIQIIEAVLPVIIQLIQTLLPIIMQIIEAVLPVMINLLNTLLPIFTTIIEAVLPTLSALLQNLIPVVQMVAEVFASVLGAAMQTVAGIVQNVMQIFQGLIDFITGAFTGNWTQAWNGIRNIFSGAVGGLGEIIKGPLRAVVSAVNTVIRGLNKVSVPDWVPGIGGKGINIPEIPGFARGTERTPETFIAGENGPELITGAAGRKVFTAAQTGQILQNIAPVVTANRSVLTEARAGQQFNRMAQAQELNMASNVNAGAGGTGTITIHVTNSHNVTVADGNAENIRAQLEQYDESFLEKIREIIVSILREQKEQEGRVAYA